MLKQSFNAVEELIAGRRLSDRAGHDHRRSRRARTRRRRSARSSRSASRCSRDAERVAAMKLQGRTALVTGAGGGFGAGIARRFAREGARVICVDIDPDAAARVVAELEGPPGVALACDIARRRLLRTHDRAGAGTGGRIRHHRQQRGAFAEARAHREDPGSRARPAARGERQELLPHGGARASRPEAPGRGRGDQHRIRHRHPSAAGHVLVPGHEGGGDLAHADHGRRARTRPDPRERQHPRPRSDARPCSTRCSGRTTTRRSRGS